MAVKGLPPASGRSHRDYRSGIKPVWCPGCGDYAVLQALTKAFAALDLERERVAVMSGIGCSSRLPAYTSVYGFHGIHGRALPAATGLKIARPDLTVVAVGGDGDGFSIGGNHFLHACRRNADLTYVVMDNEVYGMTKGQASPTTPPDWDRSKLTPGGPGIRAFQPLSIALAAGANFIARGFAGDPNGAARLIAHAIVHPGFSFVQVLSPCVTFRPEDRDWKEAVSAWAEPPTDDPMVAGQRLLADDGFGTGVLYAGQRPVYAPQTRTDTAVTDLQEAFAL